MDKGVAKMTEDFAEMAQRIIDQEKAIGERDAKIAEYEGKIKEFEESSAAMSAKITKLQGIIADNITIRKEPEGTKGAGSRSFGEMYHDMIKRNNELNKR